MSLKSLRVNAERFHANFESLSEIGATVDGGIHRPTFNSSHLIARKWFQKQIIDANLDFKIDKAGNHSAILRCGRVDGPTLLLGSHLDSVPNGGKFDGALGVMAAFEVLQTVKEVGLTLPFHLEAIDFTDEEGTLLGLLGSRAVAGILASTELLEPRGGRQVFTDLLDNVGLTEEGICNAQRDPNSLAGYLELHIEQGPRLVDANADIGIVTSIVGIGSYRITFIGRANHAGTTPMSSRLDAAQGASAFTLSVREHVIKNFPDCVANIGNITIEPGAFNIIPERAAVSLEFRAPSKELLERLESSLLDLSNELAGKYNLGLDTEFLGTHNPAPMNIEIRNMFERAAESLDLSTLQLTSGAGHDAQSLAPICPTGMIFVPSKDGISHSPLEFTSWTDCLNGANLLLSTVLDIASNF